MIKNTLSIRLLPVLFFVCLFSVLSCRKDRYVQNQQKQLIKDEAVNQWIANHPAAQLLTLDWKNAKQATVDGKKAVRIPTLNVNKISALKSKAAVQSGTKNNVPSIQNKLSSTDQGKNKVSNYFAEHKPELFLIEDDKSDLHGFLLNFIPKAKETGFGKEGIWTGQLYEWNLTGDTIFVQNIAESKLLERQFYKVTPVAATNSTGQVFKPNTLSSIDHFREKQTGSFWSWLGGVFEDIWQAINWVGYYLGIPGSEIEDPDGPGTLIRVWDFDWLTGGGGGSSSGGDSGGGYTGAGYPIYDSYIPGYYPPDVGYPNHPVWEPYPIDGNTGGPNYNPPVYSSSVMYLMNYMLITPAQLDFLRGRDDVAYALEMYFETYSTLPENVEFAEWALDYLEQNRDVSFPSLIATNNVLNATIALPNLDVSELGNYPQFKALVTDLPNFLTKYPNILKALSFTTGFSEKKIKELMQPGKGPKVVVVNNLKDSYGNDILGHFDNVNNVLQIDNGYVNGLDAVNSPVRYQAIGLMLTITTLHEFVHFGRFNNQLSNLIGDKKGVGREAGWYFEDAIAPGSLGRLQPENAIEWMRFYNTRKKN